MSRIEACGYCVVYLGCLHQYGVYRIGFMTKPIHTCVFSQASKKDRRTMFGRNDTGLAVIFPDNEVIDGDTMRKTRPGDYVQIKVTSVSEFFRN